MTDILSELRINFDYFVIPFCIGLLILLISLVRIYYSWIKLFSRDKYLKLLKGIFSLNMLNAVKEIVLESILHRRIFRVNILLGYMHASLVVGWLLMIIVGTMESKLHMRRFFNMPYDPVFLKYFTHNKYDILSTGFFLTIMDSLLLIVLISVFLAFTKRFYSFIFGLRNTTRLKLQDKLALYSLWLIFPLRWLSESSTAAIYHNGGFLTENTGKVLSLIVNPEYIEKPLWWSYSSVLAIFFIFLPYSRYMHIFTEVFLIIFRNAGIKVDSIDDSYSNFEVYSCPRCGICIDKCQIATDIGVKTTQSVYMLYNIRNKIDDRYLIDNCLLCGRCTEYCPIGIDLNRIRLTQRIKEDISLAEYSYLPIKSSLNALKEKDKIGYYAGCMTHLTPSIIESIKIIFKSAGLDFLFIDEKGSICCGRPMKLAGFIEDANRIREKNERLIKESGINLLITSCPICMKMFKEDYNLNINIMHHTQFILKLMNENKINLSFSNKNVVYHDPCELGRGMKIYKEPRNIIKRMSILLNTKYNKNNSLCCGGALGNVNISVKDKFKISEKTVGNLLSKDVDYVVTSCPLCKKTIGQFSETEVIDISELVVKNIK